ncbi:11569_t:CDS:2 [Racocetra fulgida]|uniref:11569_t:CDS:1 n=1 Tax=Racocetra fulgida TaxID=60492 RepID=A0A9N8ZFK6_9GLOM|nr:11569_t:CDS:2 [Racocetra fulgida]
MDLNKKWQLTTGKIVEDTIYEYGINLGEESLIHSWILDLEDVRLQQLFTTDEWHEIMTQNLQEVPKIPEELAQHMVLYAEVFIY